MRATLLGSAAAVLILSSLPGIASAKTIRVEGDPVDAPGIRMITQGCSGSGTVPTLAPRLRVVRDAQAPRGGGAIGWRIRESGVEVGTAVHVASPSTAVELSIAVRPRVAALSGRALVEYQAPDDPGVWHGSAPLPPSTSPGWRQIDVHDRSFRWRYVYPDGSVADWTIDSTLEGWVTASGGDGDGAWVGFAFGCNGDTFDVDALTIETATESKVINFEPYRSKASLARVGKGPARKATMIAGGNIRLKAVLRNLDGKRIAGQARLLRADQGSKKFKPVSKVRLRKSKATTVKIAPRYNSVYKLRYPGTSSRLPSTSKTVTVRVRSNARARLSDTTVIAGNGVTVKGRFGPARKAKLALQKYVGGEWTNVKRFRSAKDGTFQTTLVNRRVGKSYWRVWVPRGGGNLPGHSSTMKLVTKPKPKPDRPNPPTKPPSNPTPPPDNDPQPPLPPTGPQ